MPESTYVLLMALTAIPSATATAALREWDVVRDGKAVGDGQTDCTPAFQRLLDEAGKAGGGIVNVPAGHYRIAGTLKIPGAVSLQGTFRVPPSDAHENRPRLDGSVLLAFAGRGKPDSEPFIRLAGSTATLLGVMVTYPEWKHSDVPPVPYPPTVLAEGGTNAGVIDCCFLNSYEALRFVGAARYLVRNVHGYPSRRGLYIDACYDISRVENCHFWPFGVEYKASDPYCKWINEHGVAFEFARTDWQYVINTFCFGYGVGYKFSASKSGTCNGNFVGIGADCCRRAVLVEDSQFPGLLITNGEFVGRWENSDSIGIEIAATARQGKVSLNNCSFWGPLDRCVWDRSADTQFTAIGCNLLQWDVARRGSPAIQIDAGKTIIQGNTFGSGDLHVRIGPKVRSAIIMGNQADGAVVIDNQAGKRTHIVANEGSEAELSREARLHYRLNVGSPGDARFLRGWHTPEPAAFWPDSRGAHMRWSAGTSTLKLPVVPDKAYTVSLDVCVRGPAVDPSAGVYLDGKRIAALPDKEGPAIMTGTIPPTNADSVTLTLRVKPWSPREIDKKATDPRVLGIAVRSVTMKAEGATQPPSSANTGSEP
ncbi:MAG: glycosyl hydrolase family 28-related protein [Phycisphaerae bacterium]